MLNVPSGKPTSISLFNNKKSPLHISFSSISPFRSYLNVIYYTNSIYRIQLEFKLFSNPLGKIILIIDYATNASTIN